MAQASSTAAPQQEEEATTHRGRKRPAAASSGVVARPAETFPHGLAHLPGVKPRGLPKAPAEELAALRLAGATSGSFAPWRHSVMVCGRPVVVP